MSHHGAERAVEPQHVGFRSGVAVGDGVAVDVEVRRDVDRAGAVQIHAHQAHKRVHLLQYLGDTNRSFKTSSLICMYLNMN